MSNCPFQFNKCILIYCRTNTWHFDQQVCLAFVSEYHSPWIQWPTTESIPKYRISYRIIYAIILHTLVCRYICLYVAVCKLRSQFLLARIRRYLVSAVIPSFTSSHHTCGVDTFCIGENTQQLSWKRVTERVVSWSQETRLSGDNLDRDNFGHGWSPATRINGDNMNGDYFGHSGKYWAKMAIKEQVKNATTSYTFTAWTIWFSNYCTDRANSSGGAANSDRIRTIVANSKRGMMSVGPR